MFETRRNCMAKYTTMEMAFKRYNTTNKPVVFWGPIEPHDLKVASDITNERANIAAEGTRINHTERAVPSSYSWNPTNPLTRRQVHSADIKPF